MVKRLVVKTQGGDEELRVLHDRIESWSAGIAAEVKACGRSLRAFTARAARRGWTIDEPQAEGTSTASGGAA